MQKGDKTEGGITIVLNGIKSWMISIRIGKIQNRKKNIEWNSESGKNQDLEKSVLKSGKICISMGLPELEMGNQ